jgi:anti-sigma factor RsiW
MNHSEADMVGAYALDALSPAEEATFEAHLATCAECQAELAELRQVTDVLPLALQPQEPSAALRGRILAAIEEPERRQLTALSGGAPRRLTFRPSALVGLAAAVVILALGAWNIQLLRSNHQKDTTIAFQRQVTTALAQHATVWQVNGTPASPSASAALVQPRGNKAGYLIVRGLRPTAAGRVYEMWLIRGTSPLPAGTFRATGSTQIVPLPRPARGFVATAVTIEPKRGSKVPTGPKVLIGSLGA